jgi:uncharacterized protein (TIGR03437 family)
MRKEPVIMWNRRKALTLLGAAGAAALFVDNPETADIVEAATCVPSTPQVTEGPYWVDEKLFRSDIRTDPTTGVARTGITLTLAITIQNLSGDSCVPLAGALVDIWHCDAIGIYSDESAYNPGGGAGTVVTTGQKFLRGYQITDDNGQVQFTTIYPGWYTSRTIHIHMRVRTYSGSTVLDNYVTQLFFDDTINNAVLAQAPYSNRTSSRDTTNTNDNVYTTAANPSRMLMTVTQTSSGYAATVTAGVSMKTAAAAAPAVTSGGIANAASGVAGLAPEAWITIYGTNLATATRTLTDSDLVNNQIPTTLGGVSVQINGKAAYMYYISPTQINVLSPPDTNLGSVPVLVTNAAGTSTAVTGVMQSILPGLFVASSYVRAVRPSDGVIINGTGEAESGYTAVAAAKPGDVLELYGTGFGPTTPSADAGTVFSGAYPTNNPVTVSIGGVSAAVSFAGLVGLGLYQINVTVPATLADGDQAVIASVAGVSSPSTALLKVRSA